MVLKDHTSSTGWECGHITVGDGVDLSGRKLRTVEEKSGGGLDDKQHTSERERGEAKSGEVRDADSSLERTVTLPEVNMSENKVDEEEHGGEDSYVNNTSLTSLTCIPNEVIKLFSLVRDGTDVVTGNKAR